MLLRNKKNEKKKKAKQFKVDSVSEHGQFYELLHHQSRFSMAQNGDNDRIVRSEYCWGSYGQG